MLPLMGELQIKRYGVSLPFDKQEQGHAPPEELAMGPAYALAVPEGLSPSEAGKGLKEHLELAVEEREKHRNRIISIVEASLLAVVAVLAAYSGWAAAKWATESSLSLARASAARAEANAANLDALNTLNFDVTVFNAWFTAWVSGDQTSMIIAAKRFTPNFRRAFEAWQATNPASNPDAPPGPTYMPQYQRPAVAQASALNAKATAEYSAGEKAGSTSDDYVRTTVYLATVLFLAGLGSHFAFRGIRYGLAGVGTVILGVSIVILATSPRPP
jgi:hypothetical protein